MKRFLLLALLVAAPASAQAYEFEVDSPGPIVFDAPVGMAIAATGSAMTGEFSAVDAPGVRYLALVGHSLELVFYDADRETVPSPVELEIGEVVYPCAFGVVAGERVAVERECSCLAPDLPTFGPGTVAWEIDDPNVLEFREGGLCGGA